ncbi:MAG TPA: hypothetical protein VF575_05375 [Candidatus Saccharimonadales bacterium]|jgi:hypothetical protein
MANPNKNSPFGDSDPRDPQRIGQIFDQFIEKGFETTGADESGLTIEQKIKLAADRKRLLEEEGDELRALGDAADPLLVRDYKQRLLQGIADVHELNEESGGFPYREPES